MGHQSASQKLPGGWKSGQEQVNLIYQPRSQNLQGGWKTGQEPAHPGLNHALVLQQQVCSENRWQQNQHVEIMDTAQMSQMPNLPAGWKTGHLQGMNLPSFPGNQM